MDDQVQQSWEQGPIPEDLSRELHTAYVTYKGARDRLSAAVRARGYYSKGGKKGGGGKAGGKGKSKGKRKGIGQSLAEIKANSTCNSCFQPGHWSGDPECPKGQGKNGKGRSANATTTATDEQWDQEEYDNWWEEDDPEQQGEEETEAHEACVTSRVTERAREVMMRISGGSAATRSQPRAGNADDVRAVLASFGLQPSSSNRVTSTTSETLRLDVFHQKARQAMMVRKVREAHAQQTAPSGNLGLIVWDTACENTVTGATLMDNMRQHVLAPQLLDTHVVDENEYFRFGPGDPQASKQRYYVPCSIAGRPLIIKTSCVDDQDRPSLPWLGGRDLIETLGVVIDPQLLVCDIRALGIVGAPWSSALVVITLLA